MDVLMDLIDKFLVVFNWGHISKTLLRIVIIVLFAWLAKQVLQKFLRHLEARLIKKSLQQGEPPS